MKIVRKNYVVRAGKNFYHFSVFTLERIYKKREKILVARKIMPHSYLKS